MTARGTIQRLAHLVVVLAVAATVLVAAPGCESVVTDENFEAISTGMTVSDVEGLLGPGEEEESGGYGMGSGGMLTSSSTATSTQRVIVWKEGTKSIIVTFEANKVASKRKEGF